MRTREQLDLGRAIRPEVSEADDPALVKGNERVEPRIGALPMKPRKEIARG